MTNSNLTSQWKAIKLHLKAARSQIPEIEATREALQQFEEFLTNNELGLAHGVLEKLKHTIPESEKRKEYLINCCAAAGLMSK